MGSPTVLLGGMVSRVQCIVGVAKDEQMSGRRMIYKAEIERPARLVSPREGLDVR